MKCKHNYDNYGQCMICHQRLSKSALYQKSYVEKQKAAGNVYFQRWITPEQAAMVKLLLGDTL